jgi:hypothetical protein
MFRTITASILLSFACALGAVAAAPQDSRDVRQWQPVANRADSERSTHETWFRSHSAAPEWRVFADGPRIRAQLTSERPAEARNAPWFLSKFRTRDGDPAYVAVDDGWLLGGGGLAWFSRDGRRSYSISERQIAAFFTQPDGLYAIEGNVGRRRKPVGSTIRIARLAPGARWQVVTGANLPAAPSAIAVQRDGTMLIILPRSLVFVGRDRKVRTVLRNAPWGGYDPNSSVLSPDGSRLYVGLRQYVGEYDLQHGTFRMLAPPSDSLARLPLKTHHRIHKTA